MKNISWKPSARRMSMRRLHLRGHTKAERGNSGAWKKAGYHNRREKKQECL
jgi:hypothetical protein